MFRPEGPDYSCIVLYNNMLLHQVYKTASAFNTVTVWSLWSLPMKRVLSRGDSSTLKSVKSVLNYSRFIHICSVEWRREIEQCLTLGFLLVLFCSPQKNISFSLCVSKSRQQFQWKLFKNKQNNKANWKITSMGILLFLVCAITKPSFISSIYRCMLHFGNCVGSGSGVI